MFQSFKNVMVLFCVDFPIETPKFERLFSMLESEQNMF